MEKFTQHCKPLDETKWTENVASQMATVLEPSVGRAISPNTENRWMNQAGGNWITLTHVQRVQDKKSEKNSES